MSSLQQNKDMIKIFYVSKFPEHADYLALCYNKGLYASKPGYLLTYLGNYLNAATILFLFTYAPQDKLNEELTNHHYLLTK